MQRQAGLGQGHSSVKLTSASEKEEKSCTLVILKT